MVCVDSGSQLIAGRYELGRVLGSGGMAIVYMARDRRLERDVAVKLVPVVATTPSECERFAREARAAAGLSHPNAVTVFDAGEADGRLYIVMELVDGRPLSQELAEGGPFDVGEGVAVATSLLAALGHAHDAGIVHRDVKPSNVMVTRRGDVKLLDFGIARRLGDIGNTLTSAGKFVGTPTYLAPEQLEGRPATAATDLYMVGVLLFEMLAGEPPFCAEDPIATAIAHRSAPVPDVRHHRPDVTPELAAAISMAMSKVPDHRFADAAAMSAALVAAAAGRTLIAAPVDAPRATEVVPFVDQPRHRPWWLAGVAGLLVAAAVLWTVGGAVIRVITTGDAPERSALASPTTVPQQVTTARPTAVPTTVPQPVTTAPTSAPTASPPTTAVLMLAGVIATLQSNPSGYGAHTPHIVAELELIQAGDDPSERAAALLEDVRRWVNLFEQTGATFTLIEPMLSPLLERAESEEGDGGNSNGNGDGNGDGWLEDQD